MMKRVVLGILLAVLSTATVFGQTTIHAPDTPQTQIEVPAGPFSRVNTYSGRMVTTIPLLSMPWTLYSEKFDLSISHRSGYSEKNNNLHQAGRGWFTNCYELLKKEAAEDIFVGATGNDIRVRFGLLGRFGVWDATNETPSVGTIDKLEEQTNNGFAVINRKTGVTRRFKDVGWGTTSRMLTAIEDNGVAVNLNYDSSKRVSTITQAGSATGANKYLQFNYKGNSTFGFQSIQLKTAGVSPAQERIWHFDHDAATGRLTGVYQNGSPICYLTYTSSGNIETITDVRGYVWRYTYWSTTNPAGKLKEVFAPGATPGSQGPRVLYLNYDVNEGEQNTWVMDANGNTNLHKYTAESYGILDHPIKRIGYEKVGGVEYAESFTYQYYSGFLNAHTDKRGVVRRYTFGTDYVVNYGQPTKIVTTDPHDPSGTVVYTDEYTYSSHKLTSEIKKVKPAGSSTDLVIGKKTYDYNGPFLTSSTVWNGSQAVSTSFNDYATGTGSLVATRNGYVAPGEMSNQTSYGSFKWGTSNQATEITRPSGGKTYVDYDFVGNKIWENTPDANGNARTTQYFYDDFDRPFKTVYPDNTFSEAIPFGGYVFERLTETDRNGNKTVKHYDGRNRVFKVVSDARSNSNGTKSTITQINTYDNNDNLIRIDTYDYDQAPPSAPIRSIFYEYDEWNRKVKTIFADGTTEQVTYDANSNVKTVTDAMGRTTTNTYDGVDRLRSQALPDGTSTTASVTYNSTGWTETSTYNRGLGYVVFNSHTFDQAGRLLSSYQSEPNKTVTYTYDDAGRKKTMTVGPQTWTYNYVYGRLGSINQTVGAATAVVYTYNPDDSLAVRESPAASLRSEYSYDVCSRLTNLVHYKVGPGGPLYQQGFYYQYDADGRPTLYRNQVLNGTSFEAQYTYDPADRLTKERWLNNDTRAQLKVNEYQYDALNNRTSVARTNASGLTTVFPYYTASNDRFVSGDGYSVPLASYNANGLPAQINYPDGTTASLSYDVADRLVQVSARGLAPQIQYVYDAAGRRVRQIGGPGRERTFVFDGETVIAEVDSAGAYTFRLPGVGVVENGVQTYDLDNSLGSNTSTMDANGGLLSQNEYDAYGNELVVQSGFRSRYGFAGKHGYAEDGYTGMLLCSARFYVPTIGRFLTPDPIGHDGGLNLYAYCENSPLSRVDPAGTQGISLDSITSTTNAHVASGLRNPEAAKDALGLLRQMMREATNQKQRNIIQGGIRQLLNREDVFFQTGFRHSLKHAAEYFGKKITIAEAAQWQSVIQTVLRSRMIFMTQSGGAPCIGYIARVNGVPMVVKFFTDGDRAGQMATAFRVSNETARTLFEAARAFSSGW